MGLYLQKLLSDSTETFFILKIILLARGGGGVEKNYKNDILLENNDTSSLKSLFPLYFSSFQRLCKL